MAMMVRAAREGAPVAATGGDGRWSVLLCLAAQQSVDTGAVVSVADFAQAQSSGTRKRS
jgi:myo-inositol 2-dehydrogenase/D-chiro-inositol 1-dehydrogenase